MDFPKSVEGVGLVEGQFVDEDQSIPQVGSLIPAAWGNQVTNELLNAIRAAGLQPSEEQSDQLLKAIRVLRGGSANLGFWQWSDAAGAPGTKRVAMNHATPASVTKLFLAEVSAEELDYSQTFGLLRAGDTVCLQQRDGLDFSLRFRVIGDVVVGAGFRELPVEYVSGSGGLPAVDAVVTVLFTPAGASDSGMPVGSVMWWPSRANIPAGYGPADGQVVTRATFSDATSLVTNGRVPVVADATWLADPAKRGMWTAGDGATTIRLPDYNGKAAGSLGAVFMRGDGARSAGEDGAIQLDAMQGHWHENWYASGGRSGTTFTDGFDAPANVKDARGAEYTRARNPISDGNNGAVRTASETRPLNVTGCWVIKMHGAVTNAGAVDAVQLASDYLALLTRVSALEQRARPLGDGQTRKDLTGSRVAATTYTNTTGRMIFVKVLTYHANAGGSGLYVNGVLEAQEGAAVGGGANINLRSTLTAEVPHLGTYRLDPLAGYGVATIEKWLEWS